MSPAMAAMLPEEPSEAPASKLTSLYTAWATMMHRQSPQPRFSGLWRSLFGGLHVMCMEAVSKYSGNVLQVVSVGILS